MNRPLWAIEQRGRNGDLITPSYDLVAYSDNGMAHDVCDNLNERFSSMSFKVKLICTRIIEE